MENIQRNGHQETDKIKILLENLGTINKNKVVLETEKGSIVLFFSYKTIVSYVFNSDNEYETLTLKNFWGTTTGKLLNECEPDKNKRVELNIFDDGLRKCLNKLF